MTKLEQLNVFMSERLSAAVNEILDTVSRMMQEYDEETTRIRKENEYLKEMLKLTGWSFTEINPGVSLGRQDEHSNLQHDSETWDGWCQNPTVKEESTSIKIEQPDPAYSAQPDSEHTNMIPVPAVEMNSPASDVWNSSKSKKGKSKSKLKKKHYCLYCKKPSHRMIQHLLSAHTKEPEVAKALSYDRTSKERKQLLDLLQSKGNLLHKDVALDKTLVSSKWHVTAGAAVDYVQCAYCLGLYSRRSIANHVKRCKHKAKALTSTAHPMSGSIASQPNKELQPAEQVSSPVSDMLCSGKQENTEPVSDTHRSAEQLYVYSESAGSPIEDLGLVGEPLLSDLESQSDLTPDTSLVRDSHVHKKPTCSSSAYETIKSEDKKTDPGQNNQNEQTQTKVKDNPSDDEESEAQNTLLHICQHCSATFCSPYHLRRHEYTHTGERPFWCGECNMGFIQKYRYRNHRMTHHEERYLTVYKDQSRNRKKRSASEEKAAESELHQQQLTESTASTSECFDHSEERKSLTQQTEEQGAGSKETLDIRHETF